MDRYCLNAEMPSANMMMNVRVISMRHHTIIREEQM